MIRFYIVLLGVAILLASATQFLIYYLVLNKPSFFWETFILLVFGTGVIYRYVYQTNQSTFVLVYLSTLVLKLLAYLGYCLLMVMMDRTGAVENVVFFMIAYFVFTVVEVIFLYPRISR